MPNICYLVNFYGPAFKSFNLQNLNPKTALFFCFFTPSLIINASSTMILSRDQKSANPGAGRGRCLTKRATSTPLFLQRLDFCSCSRLFFLIQVYFVLTCFSCVTNVFYQIHPPCLWFTTWEYANAPTIVYPSNVWIYYCSPALICEWKNKEKKKERKKDNNQKKKRIGIKINNKQRKNLSSLFTLQHVATSFSCVSSTLLWNPRTFHNSLYPATDKHCTQAVVDIFTVWKLRARITEKSHKCRDPYAG